MSSQSTGDYFQYDANTRLYKRFTWHRPSNQHYHTEWMSATWQPAPADTVISAATPRSSALPASSSLYYLNLGNSVISPKSYSHTATSAAAAAPYVASYANSAQFSSSTNHQQHAYAPQHPNLHTNTAIGSYQAPYLGAAPQPPPRPPPALGIPQRHRGPMPRGRGGRLQGTYVPHSNALHYERLDQTYFVRDSAFFYEGRVFSVIMNETAGVNSTAPHGQDATDYNSSDSINTVKYEGNSVYTSVRRFVVVRQKREFCYACPIFTYSGRATTKRGVRAAEHGIAYTWGHQPELIHGEGGMTKPSVAVVMDASLKPLDVASRIYYGITHPIQYNVKVKEIGYVLHIHVPSVISSWRIEENRQDVEPTQQTQILEERGEDEDPPAPDCSQGDAQATAAPNSLSDAAPPVANWDTGDVPGEEGT